MTDVKTWMHVRQGKVRGILQKDDGTQLTIKLVGQQIHSHGEGVKWKNDGDVVVMRKELLRELPA